jgi:hypothetical protein
MLHSIPAEAAPNYANAPHYSYLILPGLYMKSPELKFSQSILSVFVVALLTAGYSFTALLCFACRDEVFQAEAIFL